MNNKCPSWWGKGAKADMKQASRFIPRNPQSLRRWGHNCLKRLGKAPADRSVRKPATGVRPLHPLPHLTHPRGGCWSELRNVLRLLSLPVHEILKPPPHGS